MIESITPYVPVCILSIGIAWAFRKLRPIVFQVFIAFLLPIIVSFAIAFVPELLKPSPPGEGWFAWTLILGATWSMVAVPVCLVAVSIFNIIEKDQGKKKNDHNQ